jgi:hypothetical protein
VAGEPPPWRSQQPPGSPPPSARWTTPPPAPAPPPSWTPRAPKPHRRRAWIYLLIGSVVAVLGLGAASVTIWVQKIKPPIDAANKYLEDVVHGRYQSAHNQLCASERVDSSPRSLSRYFEALFLTTTGVEVQPFDVRLDGSRATVKADLNPDIRGGSSDIVHLRLHEIEGHWRPCGGNYGFVPR